MRTIIGPAAGPTTSGCVTCLNGPNALLPPFDLDLALALKGQLVAEFNALHIGPLNDNSIAELERKQGVYKLFHIVAGLCRESR